MPRTLAPAIRATLELLVAWRFAMNVALKLKPLLCRAGGNAGGEWQGTTYPIEAVRFAVVIWVGGSLLRRTYCDGNRAGALNAVVL